MTIQTIDTQATEIVDTSTALKERIEEVKALVGNSFFDPGFKALNDNEIFTPSDIAQLKVIAAYLGVDYDATKNTLGVSASADSTPRLTRPTVISNGSALCFRWGEQTVEMNPKIGGACTIVPHKSEQSDYTSFMMVVDVTHEIEGGEEEIYSLEFPMIVNKGVMSLPTRSMFFKILSTGSSHPQWATLLGNFRRADSIGKLSELPDGVYNLLPAEALKTSSGKELELLEVEGIGRFWSPKELTSSMLPASATKVKNTFKIGDKEISISSYTKLKELEIGSYTVVKYTWGEMTYEGKTRTTASLELEDGRMVGANANIESFLKNATPEISKEFTATLHIDSKIPKGDNKVRVNCRLVPTKVSGLMAAIAGVARKEEAPLMAV